LIERAERRDREREITNNSESGFQKEKEDVVSNAKDEIAQIQEADGKLLIVSVVMSSFQRWSKREGTKGRPQRVEILNRHSH